jgi:hypothetical protein
MNLSPYRAVRGESWKKRDFLEWNEKRFLQFFEVVDRFTVLKGLTQVIKITSEGLMKLEQDAFSGQFPFLEELVIRMNQLTTDQKASPRTFFLKFTSLIRTLGAFIRENPSIVTEEMKSVMEKNQRVSWMLTHYVTKETKMGVPMVVEQRKDGLQGKHDIMPSADPQVKFMESINKATDLTHRLLRSVKPGDLKNMSTKDRVSLGFAGVKLLSAMKSYKPNIGVFNNIVIKNAGREELEEAMLNLNQTKNES